MVVWGVGVAYAVIGIVFAALDDSPDPQQVRLWRLAAWLVSAAVAATHVAYEHFRHASPPRTTALRAACAVALGALGLAIAANLHELLSGASYRPALLVALVVWPLMTAIPAFLLAWVAAIVLRRATRDSTA